MSQTEQPAREETHRDVARNPRGSRRARGVLVGAVVATITAGAALVGVGILGPEVFGLGGEPAAAPTERRAVDTVGGQSPAPPAAVPHRLRIPAIDFEAEVAPFTDPGKAMLYPPNEHQAFWLSDYGLVGEGAENTAYLIGHTSADGRAVFDPLVDRAAGTTTALPGDEFLVDTETGTAVYEVIAAERHEKSGLADIADVWTRTPGRLVLVTCLFDDRGRALENIVLFARLTGGA